MGKWRSRLRRRARAAVGGLGVAFVILGGASGGAPAGADELLRHVTWTAAAENRLTYDSNVVEPPVALTLPARPGTLSVRLATRGTAPAVEPGRPPGPPTPGTVIEASVRVTAGGAVRPGMDLVVSSGMVQVSLGPDAEGAPIWLHIDSAGKTRVDERVFPGATVRRGEWTGKETTLVYRFDGPARLTAAESLDFGAQAARGGWRWLPVRVDNRGESPLVLRDFTLPAGDFSLHEPGTTCRRGATLAPGAGCDVAVMFRPGAAGLRTATLTVLGDEPLTVSLTGAGAGGDAPSRPPSASGAPAPTASADPAVASAPPTSAGPPAAADVDRPARNRAGGGMSTSEFLVEWALPVVLGLSLGLWIRRRLRRRRARA